MNFVIPNPHLLGEESVVRTTAHLVIPNRRLFAGEESAVRRQHILSFRTGAFRR
jgi:hypothetical protein